MNKYRVTGTCTVTARTGPTLFGDKESHYTHPFNFVVGGEDEGEAAYTAELWATEEAEMFSGFKAGSIVGGKVKIAQVREIPETEIVLSLPRSLAPMLPGF